MKPMNFLIFFLAFLLVYFGVNYYVYLRGWQAFRTVSGIKPYYIFTFSFLSLAYIIMRFTGAYLPGFIHALLYWIGAFWFTGLLFLFLSVVFVDILRLINYLIPFFPAAILANPAKTKLITGIAVISFVALLNLAGYINTLFPAIIKLDIKIDKPLSKFKSTTIALVSDIHMGTLVGTNRVALMVKKINAANPDMVILAGDLIDEIQEPVFRNDVGSPLRNLKAKSLYAVTGNHEYIGGVESAVRYIESLGIKVLRDTCARINNELTLCGREDRSKGGRFQGKGRKELSELLKQVDFKDPVILLDHQPYHFEDVVKNKVDLQLSGHTHQGQFWPISLITNKIYELSHGYLKKGISQFYVSNGFGTWGPPIRLGNRPEIVIIHLYNSPGKTQGS